MFAFTGSPGSVKFEDAALLEALSGSKKRELTKLLLKQMLVGVTLKDLKVKASFSFNLRFIINHIS